NRNDVQNIGTTTSLFRDALALRPQCHPDRPFSLYNFTKALALRYKKKSVGADIREAAQVYQELLPLCPEGTYLRSTATGADGVDYMVRRCNKPPTDASDEGIHLRRVVLELCPLGHQLHRNALNNLARAVKARFDQCGSIDDIDETIQLHREVVFLYPEEHANREGDLTNLASVLHSRFHHQGRLDDLDEAISLHEEVLRLWPVVHKSRYFSLGNLGGALITRFKKRSDIDDITRAVSLYREALTLCLPGTPHRDTTLNNLALALITRYDELDVSEDLNEAIDRYRESLQLKQLDNPERHVTLRGLSSALCSRFTQTEKNEDVEEAITLCQESLASLSSLHPGRYFSYRWLQEAYLSRYRILHNPTDLSLAIENFRLASGHPTQGFPRRIQTALNWVDGAEGYQHDSALEAYQVCLKLFESHVMMRSSIISRREAATAFRRARPLSVDAASCAVRCDNLQQAVELVEQGRGQQWSLASRLKTPVEDLESANPTLAHTYLELSKRVSNVAQSSATITDRAAADRAATEYRQLTRQWEAAVAEIPSRMNPAESRTDLIALPRIIWDEIMLPIVNVLEHVLKLKRRSRIWLCPTAAFTSIPLHAANPFLTKPDRSKEPCLEDLYICSYTPTLSALVRSRQLMKKRVPPSFVAIGQGQPGAGKGKELLAVDSELELVYKLVPATANRTSISGDAATRAGALEALQQNTWVHLACHGKQDRIQPYDSHFVMKDKHLTLLNIMEKDIPHAEFAFLSACHTAVGDEETPDEVIHLAAGLQFLGFKSVIGTLWEVDDAVAKHVVEAFYQYMFRDGVMDCTKAAWALNCATHSVKTKVPLEQRMVFVHIGV
ncbi:CHAT domain-containing protein, partial [Suillus cothurnatus]